MKRSLKLLSVMSKTMIILLVSIMTIIFTAHHTIAFTWTEDWDAGQLPDTAQAIADDGPLEFISGSLGSPTDVDMYAIFITGDGSFSATTVGLTTLDSQLTLFDSSGMGVYSNDDDVVDGSQSTLPAFDPLTPTTPGLYYLAISDWDWDPKSIEGFMFPHPLSIGSNTAVDGPTGLGGESPVIDWDGISTRGGGSYTIAVTGITTTAPVTEPLLVSLDIRPGRRHNIIYPRSKRKIPLATLSTIDSYAPAEVDTESLTFGPVGDEESLAFCNPSPDDVSDDGYDDLVCHFYTRKTEFQCGDEQGILKGYTVNEIPTEGSDSVRIIPCREKARKIYRRELRELLDLFYHLSFKAADPSQE